MKLLQCGGRHEKLHQSVHPAHDDRYVDKVLMREKFWVGEREDPDGLLTGLFDIRVGTEKADAEIVVNLNHLVLVNAILGNALSSRSKVELLGTELHEGSTPLDEPTHMSVSK